MDYSDLHPIQEKILKRLGYSGTKSFSDIRGDIESNKFAFHLNKLQERELIKKTDEGYQTTKHAREILPYFDLDNIRHPVIVVDLLAFSNGKVYLKPKKDDPLDPFSGDYRAPSSRVSKNERIKDKAKELFREEFADEPVELKESAIFDSEVLFLDGSKQHYLLFFFKTRLEEINDGGKWFKLEELEDLKILPGLDKAIKKIKWNDSLFMGEWDVEQADDGFTVERLEF